MGGVAAPQTLLASFCSSHLSQLRGRCCSTSGAGEGHWCHGGCLCGAQGCQVLCVTSSMSLGWGLWGAFPSQGHTQVPRAALPEGLVLQGGLGRSRPCLPASAKQAFPSIFCLDSLSFCTGETPWFPQACGRAGLRGGAGGTPLSCDSWLELVGCGGHCSEQGGATPCVITATRYLRAMNAAGLEHPWVGLSLSILSPPAGHMLPYFPGFPPGTGA